MELHEQHQPGNHQKFIGYGVDQATDFGDLRALPGNIPVQQVRQGRQAEDRRGKNRPFDRWRGKEPNVHRYQQDSEERQRIRQIERPFNGFAAGDVALGWTLTTGACGMVRV